MHSANDEWLAQFEAEQAAAASTYRQQPLSTVAVESTSSPEETMRLVGFRLL